jgi:hypothetical protein
MPSRARNDDRGQWDPLRLPSPWTGNRESLFSSFSTFAAGWTNYVECDIADPDGKRIAKAMSTCAVLRGEQAKLR